MKDLRDYVNKIADEKLDKLARQVADEIFKEVNKTDEDTLTITLSLLRQSFQQSLDLQLESRYLDAHFMKVMEK